MIRHYFTSTPFELLPSFLKTYKKSIFRIFLLHNIIIIVLKLPLYFCIIYFKFNKFLIKKKLILIKLNKYLIKLNLILIFQYFYYVTLIKDLYYFLLKTKNSFLYYIYRISISIETNKSLEYYVKHTIFIKYKKIKMFLKQLFFIEICKIKIPFIIFYINDLKIILNLVKLLCSKIFLILIYIVEKIFKNTKKIFKTSIIINNFLFKTITIIYTFEFKKIFDQIMTILALDFRELVQDFCVYIYTELEENGFIEAYYSWKENIIILYYYYRYILPVENLKRYVIYKEKFKNIKRHLYFIRFYVFLNRKAFSIIIDRFYKPYVLTKKKTNVSDVFNIVIPFLQIFNILIIIYTIYFYFIGLNFTDSYIQETAVSRATLYNTMFYYYYSLQIFFSLYFISKLYFDFDKLSFMVIGYLNNSKKPWSEDEDSVFFNASLVFTTFLIFEISFLFLSFIIFNYYMLKIYFFTLRSDLNFYEYIYYLFMENLSSTYKEYAFLVS